MNLTIVNFGCNELALYKTEQLDFSKLEKLPDGTWFAEGGIADCNAVRHFGGYGALNHAQKFQLHAAHGGV